MARRPNKPAHPADQTEEDYLRSSLLAIHAEIEEMSKAGSWQAAMAGRRLALTYRKELDDLKREQPADFEPTEVDDIIPELLLLPDAVFSHPLIRERVAACS
jgi:hypothetical protein